MASDYSEVEARVRPLCDGEEDTIALMATIACELYHASDEFDRVCFYRVTAPGSSRWGRTRAATAA